MSEKIVENVYDKKYCSVGFLDTSRAFRKVRHTGLLIEIKEHLPHPSDLLSKSNNLII